MGCGTSRAAGPVDAQIKEIEREPDAALAAKRPEEAKPPSPAGADETPSVLSDQDTPAMAPVSAPAPTGEESSVPKITHSEANPLPLPPPVKQGSGAVRVFAVAKPGIRAKPSVHDRKAFTFDGGEMTVPRTHSWAKAKPFVRKDQPAHKNLSVSIDGVDGTVDAVHPSLLFGDAGARKKDESINPHRHCVRKDESLLKATARKRCEHMKAASMDGENPMFA